MTPLQPRSALAAATALALLLLAAPPATAWQSVSGTVAHDFKGGGDYTLGAGAVQRNPSGTNSAFFTGDAWVEYDFWIAGPGGVAPDVAYVDTYTGGPGSCRYQVLSATRGPLADTGWRGCDNHWETLWREDVPTATGTLTLRITYQGSGGAWVSEAASTSFWGGLTVSASERTPYASADLSELRVSGTPGTCLDVGIGTTPSHATVLEVDWGDGTTTTFPTPPGADVGYDSVTACHAYPPSTVPYQMCARLRETNGLQRATPSDCRDLPSMLPSI